MSFLRPAVAMVALCAAAEAAVGAGAADDGAAAAVSLHPSNCRFSVPDGEDSRIYDMCGMCARQFNISSPVGEHHELVFNICGNVSSCFPPWQPTASYGRAIEYFGPRAAEAPCFNAEGGEEPCTPACAVAAATFRDASPLVQEGSGVIEGVILRFDGPAVAGDNRSYCDYERGRPVPSRSVTFAVKADRRAAAMSVSGSSIAGSRCDARVNLVAPMRTSLQRCTQPGSRGVTTVGAGEECSFPLANALVDGWRPIRICDAGLACADDGSGRRRCAQNPTVDLIAADLVRRYNGSCDPAAARPCGAAGADNFLIASLRCRRPQGAAGALCVFAPASQARGLHCTYDDECRTGACGADGECAAGALSVGAPCNATGGFDGCVPAAVCDAASGRCVPNAYAPEGEGPRGACGEGRECADGFTCEVGRCAARRGAACTLGGDHACEEGTLCRQGADGAARCAQRPAVGEACAEGECDPLSAVCDGGTCAALSGEGGPCIRGRCRQASSLLDADTLFCGSSAEGGRCYAMGRVPYGRTVPGRHPYACAAGSGLYTPGSNASEEGSIECLSGEAAPQARCDAIDDDPQPGFRCVCPLRGAPDGAALVVAPQPLMLYSAVTDWAAVGASAAACAGSGAGSPGPAMQCLLAEFGPRQVCLATMRDVEPGMSVEDLVRIGVPRAAAAAAAEQLLRNEDTQAVEAARLSGAQRAERLQQCEDALAELCDFTFPRGFSYSCRAGGGPSAGAPRGPSLVLIGLGSAAGILAIAGVGYLGVRWRARRLRRAPGAEFSLLD